MAIKIELVAKMLLLAKEVVLYEIEPKFHKIGTLQLMQIDFQDFLMAVNPWNRPGN